MKYEIIEWYPENKPPNTKKKILMLIGKEVVIGLYCRYDFSGYEYLYVTHWADLPTGPKLSRVRNNKSRNKKFSDGDL